MAIFVALQGGLLTTRTTRTTRSITPPRAAPDAALTALTVLRAWAA
ncbi:hypothetical protein [Streptosporangium sp. NPDC002524]